MPSKVMKRPEDFTMEESIVAGWPGADCGLKFRRVGDDKVGKDFYEDLCNLWHNFRPVSYTHLDVYKRQEVDLPPAGSAQVRLEPGKIE